MIHVAGIDVGSSTAKAVIFGGGEIIAVSLKPVTRNVAAVAEEVIEQALLATNLTMSDLEYVVSTGYGRNAVSFANDAMTEIICHAKGVRHLMPEARTIIDIGAQDSKVIRVGVSGEVVNFVMNDKCAAGSGRFLELIAQALDVRLDEMGVMSQASQNPCQISSTCTVFAESEVVSLRAEGRAVEDLIAGVHKAIATRVVIMGSGLPIEETIVFTGGVAKNEGVKQAIEAACKGKVRIPEEPQMTGALGAALEAEKAVKNKLMVPPRRD